MLHQRIQPSRLCAVGLSALLIACPLLPLPTAAEDRIAMRIDKIEVIPDEIPADRLISVDIRIEGNEEGFIASEFGIAFDDRLTLQEVHSDTAAGSVFSYCCVPESHMVWFSGASATAEKCATTGRGRIFTLDFLLPEQYAAGDTYYISYAWNGVDSASAFWYTAPGNDALKSLMTYSTTGSITIPNPEAPRLSHTVVALNKGETCTLTAQNVTDDGLWFSDNEEVASVKDGVITALSPGSCVISVFYTQANTLLSCEVNVRNDYWYSMADEADVTIFSADQIVTLEYPDAVGSVQWITTDPSVVTVNDGKLTALSNGTAQIIASSNGKALLKNVTVAFGEGSTDTSETDEPAPAQQSGDLNGDASIDIVDVISVNKYLLGSYHLSEAQKECADVYHDGIIDTTDGLTLLKHVVEIIPTLPVEP